MKMWNRIAKCVFVSLLVLFELSNPTVLSEVIADCVGEWQVSKYISDGITSDARELGMDARYILHANGSVEFIAKTYDESFNIEDEGMWFVRDDMITIFDGKGFVCGTMKNGNIVLCLDSSIMILERAENRAEDQSEEMASFVGEWKVTQVTTDEMTVYAEDTGLDGRYLLYADGSAAGKATSEDGSFQETGEGYWFISNGRIGICLDEETVFGTLENGEIVLRFGSETTGYTMVLSRIEDVYDDNQAMDSNHKPYDKDASLCAHEETAIQEDGNLYCSLCDELLFVNTPDTHYCSHTNIHIYSATEPDVTYECLDDNEHLKTTIRYIYDGEWEDADCLDCGFWLEVIDGEIDAVGVSDRLFEEIVSNDVEAHTYVGGVCACGATQEGGEESETEVYVRGFTMSKTSAIVGEEVRFTLDIQGARDDEVLYVQMYADGMNWDEDYVVTAGNAVITRSFSNAGDRSIQFCVRSNHTDWSEKCDACTLTVKGMESGTLNAKRQSVVDRAYEWYNYTWVTKQKTVLHKGRSIEAGTKVFGLPYSLANGGVTHTPSDYEEKVVQPGLEDTQVEYSGGYTPGYGADCTQLVHDCWKAGGFPYSRDGMVSLHKQDVLPVKWENVQPGDALRLNSEELGGTFGHIMLVVEVDYDKKVYTVIEQASGAVMETPSSKPGYTQIGTRKKDYYYGKIAYTKDEKSYTLEEAYTPYRYAGFDE